MKMRWTGVIWLYVFVVAYTMPLMISVCDAAIIAHWSLDDGQSNPNTLTAADSVSPAADGTWQNLTTPRWVSGIAGGAAEFGGSGTVVASSPGIDDVISVPGTGKVDVTGAITIAAWVRYAELGGQNSTRHIAGKDRNGGTAGDAYSLKHNMTSSANTIQFLIDSGSTNTNLTSTSTLTAYTTASQLKGNDGWVHVTGVFQPSTFMRLYIDGVQDAELTGASVPSAIDSELTTPFNIGRLHNDTSHSFNGRIDDVQVYSQALSSEQVAFLYSHPGGEVSEVPEPSSTALLLISGLGMIWAVAARFR